MGLYKVYIGVVVGSCRDNNWGNGKGNGIYYLGFRV